MPPAPEDIPKRPPLDFPDGSRVLDVGSGDGRHLKTLLAAGYQAEGVEIDAAAVQDCVADGLIVHAGVAEKLPVPDASFDAILCNVVLPYVDERQAVLEWARVLRHGGIVRATYHAPGYPLKQMFTKGHSWKHRLYGLRTLLNGWCYGLLGKRLPRFLGDTMYQSRGRLMSHYERAGFDVICEVQSGSSLGMPVFLYHELRKNAK